MVCEIVGSATWMGWNRRSRAASFSRYLRYSSRVVAPVVCGSPRASMGLRIDAASIAPSAAPAPTSVWISSMNRMMSPRVRISLSTFLSRFAEVTAVPRPGDERAEVERVELLVLDRLRHLALDDLLRRALDHRGLADAGGATRTGLFMVRRDSACMTRSISFSANHRVKACLRGRPGSGSGRTGRYERGGRRRFRAPARRRSGGLLALVPVQQLDDLLAHTRFGSAPSLTRTWAATPSPSRIRPSRMCSVPM